MPVQPINFPMLRPEDVQPFSGAVQGFQQGMMFPQEYKQANLKNIIDSVKAQYAPKTAEQALQKMINENKYYAPQQESEINLRNSQSKEALSNSRYRDTESSFYPQKIKSEMEFQRAQAGELTSKKSEEDYLLNLLKNKDIENSARSSGMSVPEQGQESAYGIETPKPTNEDLLNKKLFGIDTYTPRFQEAQNKQKSEYKNYTTRNIQYNKAADESNNFGRLLNQYNYLMDHANASGVVGGQIPGKWTSASQQIENVISQMGLGAIEQVRDAMGSARFAVADLNVAMSLKPQRTWTKKSRNFYTEFTNGVNDRLKERAEFYNLASDPKRGIPVQVADQLWSSYQNNFPISNSEGNKVVKENFNKWRDFLSPEAVNSVKTNGSYTPIDPKNLTEENIQATMKATGLTREAVLTELKKKGYKA